MMRQRKRPTPSDGEPVEPESKGLALSLSKGFTLIELLVSIAIIALLIVLVVPNYLSTRERARDTRVKSEMDQLKNSLRTYYNDFQRYPDDSGNIINGCGADGTDECPCIGSNGTFDFAVGADCETVYMKKFPADRTFGSDEDADAKYYVSDDGEKFCIVTTLENYADPDLATSRTQCAPSCVAADATVLSTSYVMCSL